MNWKHLAAVVILAGSVLAQIPVGAKQVPCPVQIEGKVYGINFLRPLSDTATCEQLTTIFHEQIIAQLKQQGLLGATAANPNPRKRTLPPPAPTPTPRTTWSGNTYYTGGAMAATPLDKTAATPKKEEKIMPDWINVHNGIIAVGGLMGLILGLILFFNCFFTVHTKQAGIVERLGKFSRIAGPGLNFKVPFFDSLVYTEDLNMQLMDIEMSSKTKDDATIAVSVRVQYFVLPAS